VKLAILNSTAPGTAALLSPFFDALADFAEVDLTVLEQVPFSRYRQAPLDATRPSHAPRCYRLEPLPTRFYNRRHACAQVLSGHFRSLLVEANPDVIYILGEPGYLSTYQVVRFARRRLGKAKICLFAAQNVYQQFPPPFPSVERWVLARVDHAFPIGQDHADVLRRKGYRGATTHLPLGVDTAIFTPERHGAPTRGIDLPRPVVGYVGEFLPTRDVPSLIEAVALCRRPVGLLLVGDGCTRPEVECLSRKHGLADRVKFAGRIAHAQIPDYMNYMDMLVLPSKAIQNRCFGIFRIANAEQFGRVLVEAMACGKPVIGSSCGEIPNVIGNAGKVYPEGDTGALAAAIEGLCADQGLRTRLGRAGLARARARYDWRVIAAQLLSTMRGLLGPAPSMRQRSMRSLRRARDIAATGALTPWRTGSLPQ